MGAYVCGWTRKEACVALTSAVAELIALTTGLTKLRDQSDCMFTRAVKQQVFEEGRALFTKPVTVEVMHRLLPLQAGESSQVSQRIKEDQKLRKLRRSGHDLRKEFNLTTSAEAVSEVYLHSCGINWRRLFGTLHSSGTAHWKQYCREQSKNPDENSYDVGQWIVDDAGNDMLGILPRLVL
eukprot:1127634-Amphidinium_carterae.5